jgi:hypothetical protein
VHLTTGIYEGQTLKPSGVKLREEVLRATAEKDIDIEQVSRRRQHDAHNDPLLSLPKSIPDTQLLILSSGLYDLRGLTSITKILLYDNLAASDFVNVLDVGHIHHIFPLPDHTPLQSIDDMGSLFATRAPNELEPSEESYTGYISAQLV